MDDLAKCIIAFVIVVAVAVIGGAWLWQLGLVERKTAVRVGWLVCFGVALGLTRYYQARRNWGVLHAPPSRSVGRGFESSTRHQSRNEIS
jgi:predicted membrane chloride channel (bestrophin family)